MWWLDELDLNISETQCDQELRRVAVQLREGMRVLWANTFVLREEQFYQKLRGRNLPARPDNAITALLILT